MSMAALSETALVAEAASLADRLFRREHRGFGDTIDAAQARLSRRLGVEESALFALRYPYRWPKQVGAGVYLKLKAAADLAADPETALGEAIRCAEEVGLDAENSPAYRAAKAAMGHKARDAARRQRSAP